MKWDEVKERIYDKRAPQYSHANNRTTITWDVKNPSRKGVNYVIEIHSEPNLRLKTLRGFKWPLLNSMGKI